MYRRNWTIEEDNYIRENFGNISFSQMSKYLSCNISTVERRAEYLGLEVIKKTQKRWTKEEIELLREMAPKYLNKTIAKKLGRTVQEVNKKARALNIELIFKRDVWKKWQINFLKDNIDKMSISQISKETGISYHHIVKKIEELGLNYDNNNWTEEEEKTLIELAPKCYIREIAKVLNRTEGAIISKVRKMGLDYITTVKEYTIEELDYIKQNWGIIPASEMARKLGVSRMMVQTQANSMNLPKLGNNPYRKWNNEEIEKLRKLSKKKTITELANYFKTTNVAIISIAARNDIALIDGKVRWTEEDNNLLREYAKTMNLSEIAIKMNRSTSSIRLQAGRQGISIRKNDSVWTEENNRQLIELISQNKTLLEIVKIMNKKDETLLNKAKKLGLEIRKDEEKAWTEIDNQKLMELSKTKKLSELVIELNRTTASIKRQAKKLGIKLATDKKQWTEEEYQQLKQMVMIDKMSVKEIAEKLGRTEDAINLKINRSGLINQTNDKKQWTEEEELLLSDLWGSEPIEIIAKKLNRTVSSLTNKAFQLELGSMLENNYNGLTIKHISELFGINKEIVIVSWVSLGLKYKVQKISKSKSYRYVEIKDLYEFLENNQDIWDSRLLEKNILGIEPEWLQKKRKRDRDLPTDQFKIDNLTKQQLIQAKKYFLELENSELNNEIIETDDENTRTKVKSLSTK